MMYIKIDYLEKHYSCFIKIDSEESIQKLTKLFTGIKFTLGNETISPKKRYDYYSPEREEQDVIYLYNADSGKLEIRIKQGELPEKQEFITTVEVYKTFDSFVNKYLNK